MARTPASRRRGTMSQRSPTRSSPNLRPRTRPPPGASRHHPHSATRLLFRSSADDFYVFDLILAADETNLRDARAIRPADATADLRLMLDLIPGRGGGGVTDPYYGKDDGFAATWDDVAAVAAALVAEFSPKE